MMKILEFLEFSKAVPGPQKIRCSQLEQNCRSESINFYQIKGNVQQKSKYHKISKDF
jgi:hypothetical protein